MERASRAARASGSRPQALRSPCKSPGGPEATPDQDCRPYWSRQDTTLGASSALPPDHPCALTCLCSRERCLPLWPHGWTSQHHPSPPSFNQGPFPPQPALLSLSLPQIQGVPSSAWTSTPSSYTHTPQRHTQKHTHTDRGTHTHTEIHAHIETHAHTHTDTTQRHTQKQTHTHTQRHRPTHTQTHT